MRDKSKGAFKRKRTEAAEVAGDGDNGSKPCWINWSTSGLLVTIPVPRGKNVL